MRENNNIKSTCRLCLARIDETELIGIFPQTYLNGVSLVMKIMVCVSLTIQEDDPFPKKICKECEESVNTFYSFRETCSRAYFTLIQNVAESKVSIEASESQQLHLAGHPCVETSASNTELLLEEKPFVSTINPSSLISTEISEDPGVAIKSYARCTETHDIAENNKTCNDNLDLEKNIPQRHILCLDTENRLIELRKELDNEENILSRNQVPEDPVISLKPALKSEEDIPEAVEELSSTVAADSLNTYNIDVDCYQVEEIHEQILCGKEIEQRVKYKCLRCENNFDDLDSVTAHYSEYCQPVDYQEANNEWVSPDSDNEEDNSNYLDTFEYLNENFELKSKEATSLKYPDHHYSDEDVNSNNRSEISELKRIIQLETAEDNHCTKRDFAPHFDSTSSCNSAVATESFILVSRKSCSSFREDNSTNHTSQPEITNLGNTQKRKDRWLGKIEYPCSECKRIFTSSSLLKRHSSVHTGERPHVCEVCDRRFAQLGQLNFHRKFHNNPRYRCHVCSKPFLRPSDIEKHMRTHTGEKPYDCKICLKSFAQLGALQQHSRIHSGEKPYSCEICGKQFSQKANKTKHVKIHKEGERPHTCYICGRSFSELSEMELHKAGHGGGRPRKCDYCEDSFRKLSELNHHVRRFHTFEKQHKCMFCPKEFYSIYNLKQHVMVHTGQRPYACSKCDLRFTQKGNLTKHFERKHSEFIDKKDHYVLVDDKSLDDENLIFVEDNINEDDLDDNLIVEREETIESGTNTTIKTDHT